MLYYRVRKRLLNYRRLWVRARHREITIYPRLHSFASSFPSTWSVSWRSHLFFSSSEILLFDYMHIEELELGNFESIEKLYM